jgi:hypothetical protein
LLIGSHISTPACRPSLAADATVRRGWARGEIEVTPAERTDRRDAPAKRFDQYQERREELLRINVVRLGAELDLGAA